MAVKTTAGFLRGVFERLDQAAGPRGAGLYARLPFVILAVGLLITSVLVLNVRRDVEHGLDVQFRFQAGKLQSRLQNRLETHADILRGVQGLFMASREVTREEFRLYVDSLALARGFPGIQGVGFAKLISPEQLDAHVESVRQQGFPAYRVVPAGRREQYSSIVYLEPFTGRNLRAFGYDMFSEPVRRAAMERARDSGMPALSGRVTLVQETSQEVQAGFLIYVPIYRQASLPATIEARRAGLVGWAYSPMRMNDFVGHLLAAIDSADIGQWLDLEIYDGPVVAPDKLMFDGDGTPGQPRHEAETATPSAGRGAAHFRAQLPVDFGGQRWTLLVTSLPAFDARLREPHLILVGVGGAVISATLALLFWVMFVSHRRVAQALAETARVNRELENREETFRTLFETVPQGVTYHDARGRFLMANPAAQAMLGLPLDQLRQFDFADPDWHVIGEDGAPFAPDELPAARALKRREPVRDVVLGLRASGASEPTWLRMTAVPIDQHGNSARFYTVFEDITARKRAETELESYRHSLEVLVSERTEQLEAANQTLQSRNAAVADLYNRAPCGYHTLDPDGLVTNINDTELAWLGYARDDVVGRLHFPNLLAEPSRAAFWIHYPHFLETGSIGDLELDMLRKDGTALPVVLSATLVCDEQGQVLASRGTVFDNTERKERMRQIDVLNAELARRAEQAEAANRAKSALLANMSHEFRTPMNAILGLTHILSRALTDPAQVDKLNKVTQAANHLLSILNTVLDLANVETGRLKLHFSRFNLGILLELCLEHAQSSVGGKPLTLSADIAPALRRVVEADAERLGQVVDKLMENAVKFTATGGVILRARCLEESESGLLVRIEVEDTGIGISAEDQDRLFQPFTQLDGSSTRQYGGSGLGLAVSKRMVELMGGAIGVSSRLGEGSTFWLTLRLAKV